MAREDLDTVTESDQPVQAVEEVARALARLHGKVRTCGIPDEQRVAGQEQPRLVAAGVVDDRKARVLGPVPGRVHGAQRDLADDDLLAILERLERVRRLGDRVDPHRDAVLEREAPVAGDVVGVRVRLQHGHDAHVVALGLLQVALDRVRGVDDDGLVGLLVAYQVGGTAEIFVHKLAEDHKE